MTNLIDFKENLLC